MRTHINTDELPTLTEAIRRLVAKHGHPDEIPISALVEEGVEQEVSDICFEILTGRDFPADPGAATAKWMRLIGEQTR